MTPMAAACFVANWKMNKTASEARRYLDIFQKRLPEISREAQIILAPPYTVLAPMYGWIRTLSMNIGLAAQNLHFLAEGAYTGEISAAMIYETGCRHVIVGHSERRIHFHETDQVIAQKVAQAQIARLSPILCVGENAQQRQNHKTISVVKHQVQKGFCLGLETGSPGTGCLDLSDCIIAYEPVWAIGTGKTPLPEEVEEAHYEIGRCLQSEGVGPSNMPRILYGGSVNEKNVAAFMKEPHIDGVLAGGASLSAELFAQMIERGLMAKER